MMNTVCCSILALSFCTAGFAGTLDVNASGTFSPTDTADTFVTPGGTFDISFLVDSNPVLSTSDYTSVSFDVPVSSFTYTLDGVPVSVTPTEITFDTLANGGGFALQFPTAEFIFSGDQMFSGLTLAPVFSTGKYSESWELIDVLGPNFDSGTGPVTVTPEPSFLPILLCGGLAVLAFRSRKFTQVR